MDIQAKSEFAQGAVSYGIGGGGAMLASLVDISHFAQAVAVILGCIIVAIRLIHDTIRLYRYIKKQ